MRASRLRFGVWVRGLRASGHRALGLGQFRVQGFRVQCWRVQCSRVQGFRVQGFRALGFQGLGFQVLGFSVLGFQGCRVQDFRVQGSVEAKWFMSQAPHPVQGAEFNSLGVEVPLFNLRILGVQAAVQRAEFRVWSGALLRCADALVHRCPLWLSTPSRPQFATKTT